MVCSLVLVIEVDDLATVRALDLLPVWLDDNFAHAFSPRVRGRGTVFHRRGGMGGKTVPRQSVRSLLVRTCEGDLLVALHLRAS